MNTKENTTKMIQTRPENKMNEGSAEILSEGFTNSNKSLSPAESQLQNILVNSAQRLSNVAHSLIEAREDAYLVNDESYPTLNSIVVDDVVKLCAEAREQARLALAISRMGNGKGA